MRKSDGVSILRHEIRTQLIYQSCRSRYQRPLRSVCSRPGSCRWPSPWTYHRNPWLRNGTSGISGCCICLLSFQSRSQASHLFRKNPKWSGCDLFYISSHSHQSFRLHTVRVNLDNSACFGMIGGSFVIQYSVEVYTHAQLVRLLTSLQ